ncbi:hypothetical protein [Mycoplasmopsis cynos]|uniref:hypothetical protein n=1 Tax=Mycoplasmopsis cynos TaxID=171284 RepID=UPI003A5C868D
MKNHNVLAINRAVELEVVSLGFEYKFENFVSFILYKIDRKKINENNFKAPIIDALKRLIFSSVEREIFNDLFARAEKSPLKFFQILLRNFLIRRDW